MKKRLLKELGERCRVLFFFLIGALVASLTLGCGLQKWTRISFVNLNDRYVKVKLQGVSPNPALIFRTLQPATGTEQLKEVILNFHDPVLIDDQIHFFWIESDGNIESQVVLSREAFGLPAKIQGGIFKIIFTAQGEWELDHCK